MIKKTINYVDFNGNNRTDEYYFHLSVPEATRIAARFGEEGWEAGIKRVVDSGNFEEVLSIFEDVILTSYGEKSADGRAFNKNETIKTNFENSQAYAELFEELVNDPDAMTKFSEGIGMTNAERVKNNVTKFTPENY